MILQTNSYIVPREKRAEHARLLARFRQSLARNGCDQFEVYEQTGPNWGSGESGRFVQIMRFRDRKHQQQVQAAERDDPGAQTLIKEFCELVNFQYQQQNGMFMVGYYNSVLAVAPARVPTAPEPMQAPAPIAEELPPIRPQESEPEPQPEPQPHLVHEPEEESAAGNGQAHAPPPDEFVDRPPIRTEADEFVVEREFAGEPEREPEPEPEAQAESHPQLEIPPLIETELRPAPEPTIHAPIEPEPQIQAVEGPAQETEPVQESEFVVHADTDHEVEPDMQVDISPLLRAEPESEPEAGIDLHSPASEHEPLLEPVHETEPEPFLEHPTEPDPAVEPITDSEHATLDLESSHDDSDDEPSLELDDTHGDEDLKPPPDERHSKTRRRI